MPRYIDADNVKLKGISVFDQNLEMLVPLSDVRKSLQMTPTADVVEVVRCKDCAVTHNQWTGCPKLNGLVTPPDFYCGYGERRKEDDKYDAGYRKVEEDVEEQVFYLCDKKKCKVYSEYIDDKMSINECRHTSDISYARNFGKIGDVYFEKDKNKPEEVYPDKECDSYIVDLLVSPSGRCLCTKNLDICKCEGDKSKCDFYPEKKRGE